MFFVNESLYNSVKLSIIIIGCLWVVSVIFVMFKHSRRLKKLEADNVFLQEMVVGISKKINGKYIYNKTNNNIECDSQDSGLSECFSSDQCGCLAEFKTRERSKTEHRSVVENFSANSNGYINSEHSENNRTEFASSTT